jgi:hypothetical protein
MVQVHATPTPQPLGRVLKSGEDFHRFASSVSEEFGDDGSGPENLRYVSPRGR